MTPTPSDLELDYKRDPRTAVGGGVIAGLVGGALLLCWQIIMQAGSGHGFWAAFKGASSPFFGARATEPGFDAGPVLVGFLAHFAIAALWGLLFGLVAFGLSRGATIIAGLLWGIVVWIGMFYVVLPLAGMWTLVHHVPVVAAVIEHLAFGLVLGIAFLPFQRSERRPLGGGIVRT